MNENLTIIEVAKILHADQATIRSGLISGKLPFGVAIKCKRHFTYIIPRTRFDAWYNGNNIQQEAAK